MVKQSRDGGLKDLKTETARSACLTDMGKAERATQNVKPADAVTPSLRAEHIDPKTVQKIQDGSKKMPRAAAGIKCD